MLVFITGGCKNGKSSKAEKIAFELSKGQKLFYLATMIASDKEDEDRIKKHIDSRKAMPFSTIEMGTDIDGALSRLPKDATVLLDSLTALLSNEMFKNDDGKFVFCEDAASKVYGDVSRLSAGVGNLVIVSDYIQSDAASYDEYTNNFREGLSFLEERLSAMADRAIEMVAGKEMPVTDDIKRKEKSKDGRTVLVIGGAFQGKGDFAIKEFRLSKGDIYECNEEQLKLPEGYRCYGHVERYVLACVNNNLEPVDGFKENTVVIMDDIFCGVVPVDELTRHYRERAGRFMQEIAAHSEVYRVFCRRGIKL